MTLEGNENIMEYVEKGDFFEGKVTISKKKITIIIKKK